MLKQLKDVTRAPEGMDPKDAKASVRFGSGLIAVVCLFILAAVLVFIDAHVEPESPLFLAAQSARIAMIGLLVSVVKFTVALSLALFAGQVVENSKLGGRIGSKAILYGALILAAALAFGGAAQ